jgi:magnesium-transporting ATPase (P-type)
LFNAVLPLDLPVTLIFIKLFYMLLIESDVSMIDEEASIEENAIVGCDVKNLGMLEDVARVNHIFCDKTGTLTKN